MPGTSSTKEKRHTTTMRTPAEQFRDRWYAQFIGILIPATLPLMEQIARETPSRIEAELFRDRWHAQIAHITMPWLFPAP